MEPIRYHIVPVESPPFGQVAYVVWNEGTRGAIVVDPGFDTGSIEHILREHDLQVEAIVNTHGHADHIVGNAAMKNAHPEAPLMIGRNEAHLLSDPVANLSEPFGMPFVSPGADRLIDDGETLHLAGLQFEAREISGHSPGSMVLVGVGVDPPMALVGDVIFARGVGRADFPGGSFDRLAQGIRSKIFDLPDETRLYPGHGPPTTVGAERRHNPFVGDQAGPYGLS